jgi:hypothetical protein
MLLVSNTIFVGRRLASLVLAILVLVGCGSGHTEERTYPDQVGLTVTGTLAGERTQEHECVWLIDQTGKKFDLVLPTGWWVAYRPVRLTDPGGKLFAQDGDTLTVSGPSVFGETMCASGPPFIVEQIDRVASR